jgi:hypothetical protein
MDELNFDRPEEDTREEKVSLLIIFGLPAIILLYAVFGILETSILGKNNNFMISGAYAESDIKNFDKANILSGNDFAKGLKDTVYTTKDCWLELRIDQQMLYQHWRDGSVETYPVSTGDKHLDSKALESRPGLFAIFFKNAHHMSSQFDLASMYHYMPFNQGIGFHSINGNEYYQYLGKKPSSHGCIRLSRSDAEKLFKGCEMGTLVIAHSGQTARTVGFAPKDYKNERQYTQDEYKMLLSKNLYDLLHGRFFVEEREFFVLDPKVIPPSGVYISYDKKIPKQVIPREYVLYRAAPDRTAAFELNDKIISNNDDGFYELASNFSDDNSEGNELIQSDKDLIKKYFHNPIGIMPIFPPSPRFVTRVVYVDVPVTETQTHSSPGGSNINNDNDIDNDIDNSINQNIDN